MIKKIKIGEKKKLKQDSFVPLQFLIMRKKLRVSLEKLKERFHQSQKAEMVLGMIQYLFQKIKKKLLVNYCLLKNIKLIIDTKLLKKSKDFFKIIIFDFIKI